MTTRLLVALMLALGIGCGKQPRPTPASEGATASTIAPSGEDAGVRDQAQIAKILQDLTQAVRKFGVEQQRPPKSLEDLVGQGYLTSVPAAPDGKKFAINKQLQVYLADR